MCLKACPAPVIYVVEEMMVLDNWEDIARRVGAVVGEGEMSSTPQVLQAIESILGEQNMRDAVHYYIDKRPGYELLRGLLWHLHSASAMDECYQVFRTADCLEDKQDAIELLRVVADDRVLPWISEFLAFDDEGIQYWGICIVDQLLFSEFCDLDEVQSIMDIALAHTRSSVRDKAQKIMARAQTESEENGASSE